MKKRGDILKLITAIVLCEMAGVIGSVFTASAIPAWYGTLTKPAINPPAWVFGTVWTLLYALMGVAAYPIWTHPSVSAKEKRTALMVFDLQLTLNTL